MLERGVIEVKNQIGEESMPQRPMKSRRQGQKQTGSLKETIIITGQRADWFCNNK